MIRFISFKVIVNEDEKIRQKISKKQDSPNKSACASLWHVWISSSEALRERTRSQRCKRPVSESLAHTLCNRPPCSG